VSTGPDSRKGEAGQLGSEGAGLTEYKNMPEPKPLLTLSWEDIVDKAALDGVELTRDQVIEIFDNLDVSNSEPIMDTFWHMIRHAIDNVSEEEDED